MGGRGAKSARNSFTRDGGGGAREAGENPQQKEPLPPRDQASAEELETQMWDLAKDAESSGKFANQTNSLSEAKRNIGYAKESLAEHAAKMNEIKTRFNPTKQLLSSMQSDIGKVKTQIARAEAKIAAGKYTKP